MQPLPPDTTLVVIDVQQAFNHPRWGQRNNPGAEARAADLLRAWREARRPIVHVHHVNPQPGSLFNPGGPGVAPKPEVTPEPGEPVITKSVNSAFIGTPLEDHLRSRGVTTVVLFGITTDHCVSTTARMAGNLGFVTYVVADATATFERTAPNGRRYTAEEMHDTALTSLSGEFATVVDTADVLAALD
jgi:nicotinamidase-related amidase